MVMNEKKITINRVGLCPAMGYGIQSLCKKYCRYYCVQKLALIQYVLAGEQAKEPEPSRTEPFARRIGSGMAGIISKLKSVSTQNPPQLESNPIMQYFEIGKESSNAGPGLVWRVHDAYRKSDGKECSVFIFDKRIAEKLYKPKRKESMLDRLRACVALLEKLRHPKMLQIIHSLEEGHNTIAFASEHVLASLHNILAWHESTPVVPGAQPPVLPHPVSLGPPGMQSPQVNANPQRPPYAKEYFFLDIELRYGLLQIIEALHYLHYTARQIHRNVCPQVIIVTRRGTWKLFGLEFIENILGDDPTEMLTVAPWSIKVAKIAQPNLDYLAPEVQTNGNCNILSDMFSLGLVICAVFNSGKPLIQANNNPMLYVKQIEFLDEQVSAVLPRVPAALQEAVQRLLSRDPHPRPTTQLLPLIKYFKCQSEVAIQAMQFLDVITMKDPNSKSNFYRQTLIDALPYIPKKLRWQLVWPALQLEVRTAEVLAAVLQPIIWLTNEATPDEFSHYVLPTLKNLMNSPKSVQASVTVLENLHIILKKCKKDEVNNEIMPMLYTALDNNTNQIQTSSLIAMQNVSDYIEDKALHGIVLGKVKVLLEKNQSDVKIISLILGFYEKILVRLERNHILEQVIPTLLSMRLSDPDIINRVVRLYKSMLLERKFGLTTNVMATKMIPSLAPQTVNPALNVDQFTNLMEILYDMLDNIDKNQRYKLKLDSLTLPSPERHRPLRHQMSTDNMNVPPFNIPNLRVEQRKTSSAEDMARKNSIGGQSIGTGSVGGGFKSTGIGQWFFGSSNSTTADNNFLRVASAFPNRRLSDNTLMTPKIRIAPSCASSPGGTPGGNSGLPTRRHSSIGPQERRGSAVNLSPPTGGSMPNTSSSVPFLLTSSMQSIRSRRPSACLSGSQGSGILQQLSSGMVRHLPVGSSSSVHNKLPTHWGALQGATSAGYNALQHTAIAVRKCPSLNITLTR
ncbi:SCY1-like protein 2 isoform X2 [Cydia pomonella]|uniref:SCY1-like protein 2 isoform X2 n=1 Tax=Cydia pomonella TaxID=82600 RepID=UPI002ADDF366|nr:SCY1-like protein 2 isoform X2 [Cydia pomonella]